MFKSQRARAVLEDVDSMGSREEARSRLRLGKSHSTLADLSDSTAEHLRELSTSLLDICNTKNFSDPVLWRLAPNVKVEHESFASGKLSFVEHFREVTTQNPQCRLEFVDTSVSIDGHNAAVWLLLNITGLENGLRAESVGILDWKLTEGVWFCTRHRGKCYVNMNIPS